MRHLFSIALMFVCQTACAEAPEKIEVVTTVIEQKNHGLTEAEVKEINEIYNDNSNINDKNNNDDNNNINNCDDRVTSKISKHLIK